MFEKLSPSYSTHQIITTSIVILLPILFLLSKNIYTLLFTKAENEEPKEKTKTAASKFYSLYLATKFFETKSLSEEEILQKEFERNYNIHLKLSSYRKVILPPTCRRKVGNYKNTTIKLNIDETNNESMLVALCKKLVETLIGTFTQFNYTTNMFYGILVGIGKRFYKVYHFIKWFITREEIPPEVQEDDLSESVMSSSMKKNEDGQQSIVLSSIKQNKEDDLNISDLNVSIELHEEKKLEFVTPEQKKDNNLSTSFSALLDSCRSASFRGNRNYSCVPRIISDTEYFDSQSDHHDENGYFLNDSYLDSKCTPLLVFVNSRSGGQQGLFLLHQLRQLLNPVQIWDLANDGKPEVILNSFKVFSRLRLLVCGGDGTVSWIISAIERVKFEKWPPIAILPLGTGNDLARIHGWGGGYENENLVHILEQVSSSSCISLLDLWTITVRDKNNFKKIRKITPFMNYLGVGADAQAALQFHQLRESKPKLFFNRSLNKLWYAVFGAEDVFKASCAGLPDNIVLEVDGVKVPLPEDTQGIIFLNIDSYSGGVPLWSTGVKANRGSRRMSAELARKVGELFGLDESFERMSTRSSLRGVDSYEEFEAYKDLPLPQKLQRVTSCSKPSSCQDGMLDVVAVRGAFHLGQIRVGLSNAQLICQCREASIKLRKTISVQIDGEPWKQSASTITVRRKKDSAMMLKNMNEQGSNAGAIVTEVSDLLDWAEEKAIIDRKVHYTLLKEFSRRIEEKQQVEKKYSNFWLSGTLSGSCSP